VINRWVTRTLVLLFRLLARLQGRGPGSRPEPDRIESILIVATTSLGDTMLTTPAVAAVRRAWPDARVTALVHRRWTALFEHSPRIDRVIPYPGKYRKVIDTRRELKRVRADLALILMGNDPDVVPLVYLAGARYIVCRASTKFRFLLDRPVPLTDPDQPVADRVLNLVRAVAGDVEPVGLELFLSPEYESWGREYLSRRGVDADRILIALNPGGSRQAKQWSETHWQTLIDRLADLDRVRLLLIGSPDEKPVLDRLAQRRPDRCLTAARKDVLESAALLHRAQALIGPDSGLAHVAVGLDVPAVVLFGPDNPRLTGPFHSRRPAVALSPPPGTCPDQFACHKKECHPKTCLEGVTPDQVIQALQRDLNLTLAFESQMS
jgi:ADP-heptose:LPS heptosyltransferase